MQINRKVILILGSSLISIGGVFFITSCSKKVYPDSRIIHKFDGSDWFNFKSGDVVNITLEKDNHNSLDGYFTINKNSNWIGNLIVPLYIHDEKGKGIYEFNIMGYEAFKNCTTLTSVDFSCARSIQDQAFYGCTNLNSIDFGTTSTVATSAFEGCTSLSIIDFKYVSNYGFEAFKGCSGLTNITFRHIESMENLVFQNDINLNSINFSTLDYHNWNIVNWGEHIFSDINASGEIIANTLEQANGWLNILKTNTDRFGDSFASWSTASLS